MENYYKPIEITVMTYTTYYLKIPCYLKHCSFPTAQWATL